MGKSLQWILIATVGHVFHISKTGPKMLVSRQIGTMAFILNTRRHPRVHLMKKPSTSMQHWHRPLHTKYSQSWSDITLSSSYYCSSIPIERDTSTSTRIQAIHNELNKLGIDAEEFESAVERSMSGKDDGYDIQYGRSAIRAYRSFVYSRLNHKLEEEVSNNNNRRQPPPPSDNLQVAAIRFARQIDFLIKRHKSHITDWVRHTDDTNGSCPTRFPLILVLDNIRSAFNVGSIFRTADACGVCFIITTGITPHPRGSGSEKVSKSALGAEEIIPHLHFATTKQALEYLKQQCPNVVHIALETTSRSRPYTDMVYPGGGVISSTSNNLVDYFTSRRFIQQKDKKSVLVEPGTALVLGNEVTGVDTQLLEVMDFIVEIPMFGVKNSLNVAACAPVVLYEILRQWKVVIGCSNATSMALE